MQTKLHSFDSIGDFNYEHVNTAKQFEDGIGEFDGSFKSAQKVDFEDGIGATYAIPGFDPVSGRMKNMLHFPDREPKEVDLTPYKNLRVSNLEEIGFEPEPVE